MADTGDWDAQSSWSNVECGGDEGTGYPVAGDTATVCVGNTINLADDEEIKVLDVAGTLNTSSQTLTISQSGADLNITGSGVMNIDDNGMVLITGGGTGHSIETDARLNLLASGSILRITTSSPVAIGGLGAIVGSDDAASIEIGYQSGGSTPVVFTSEITIRGHLVIDDVSGESGSFTNEGTVEADASGTLKVAVAGTLADGTNADRWKVTANGAKLKFDSTIGVISTLDGNFIMPIGDSTSEMILDRELATNGRLQISSGVAGVVRINPNGDNTVTFDADYATDPNPLDMQGGTIEVAAGKMFTHN